VVPELDARRSDVGGQTAAWQHALAGKTVTELVEVAQELASLRTAKEQAEQERKNGVADAKKRIQELDQRINEKLPPSFERWARQTETDARWKGLRRELIRADELPSPAPPGHLLREFGQGERAVLGGSNRSLSLTQALRLMNGVIDQEISRPNILINRLLAQEKTPEGWAGTAILAVLTRLPDEAERSRFAATSPEDRADRQGQDRPRQPDLADNHGMRRTFSGERGHHFAWREPHRANAKRDDKQQRRKARQRRQQPWAFRFHPTRSSNMDLRIPIRISIIRSSRGQKSRHQVAVSPA